MNWIDVSENDNRHLNRYGSLWNKLALLAEWANIPQQMIRNLTSSMGRRCQAVIDAGGGRTIYRKMVTLTCEYAMNWWKMKL
jgi:hypothetical protein